MAEGLFFNFREVMSSLTTACISKKSFRHEFIPQKMVSYLAVPQGRNYGCVFRRSQSDSDWRLLGMVQS